MKLFNANKKYVKFALWVMRQLPDGVVPFSVEAARVGQDTKSWVRIIGKNAKHQVMMTLPDLTDNTVNMHELPTYLTIEVSVEYTSTFNPKNPRRVWRLVGTRKLLNEAVAKIQVFEPQAKIASPNGIHPI